MKIIKTNFKDLKLIQQKSYSDKRGSLKITHNQKNLNKKFVLEYCTTSLRNSLRGFHFQYKNPQAKYVTVLKGKILDCVIDLRKNSKTFGKVYKVVLSDKNNLALYIPEGFAHAYYSYEKLNIIYYKLTNYYYPKYEDGILSINNGLKIKWPVGKKIISKKDRGLKTFSEFKKIYKFL